MATYPTGWLRLPTDAKDFKERFAWSHVKAIFYDKAKNILLKDKLDAMDKLISDHADAIANKLMTNDAFNTAIADYVTKSMMSGVQVNDGDHVPTSALAYAMQQAITANANAITKLNSEAFFVPVSYFRDKINKTYSRIEVFIFGKLVVIRVNVLVDDFDKYYGEATDDLRNIPALAHLSDTLEVRTPGSVRTNDNVTTLKQYGTILISGGKIFADMPEKTISSGYISGQIITYLLQ
ncbi:hypothetical protein [Clostridium sp. AF22-10]|uniref:hypothetical protein n=1 Tax=Clostridium sp. AF22-10 TaxID=2293004 RepID=UPI000E4FBC11|nr:hypothetical protein DWX91_13495 [Clostridium sp. AF22-10]